MRILLTGSASHLARALLPRLCEHSNITAVTGIDIQPAVFAHAKFQHHLLDIRDSSLPAIMQEHDALIHTAFVVLRSSLKKKRHDRQLIRDINLRGSQHVFRSAQAQGIRHCIHLSSAAVYGAWPDNPALMDENQPLRAMPGFSYAEDKVAVEEWLNEFEQQHPHVRLVRLRPHVILGKNAQPFLLQLLRQPFYPRLPDPQPLSQCVCEEDVVDAIVCSLFCEARGALNLAAQPPLSFRDMIQLNHRISLPLPYGMAKWLQKIFWLFTSMGEEPGWMDGMPYSLAVDTRKAQQQLGWHSRFSTQECVQRVAQRSQH